MVQRFFWRLMGGLAAMLSINLVVWLAGFKYPAVGSPEAITIIIIYVLWFVAGAMTADRFLRNIKGK